MTKQLTPDKNDAFLAFASTALLYLAASLILGSAQSAVGNSSPWWWVFLALSSVAIGGSAVAYCAAKKANVCKFCALDVPPSLVFTLLGCVATIALLFFMAPLTNWLYDLMERVGLTRPSVALPLQLVPLLLTVTILPAFCEEIVFRGMIANGFLRSYRNRWGAVLLSGAIFSLFHANPAQTVHQFVLGCLLAFLIQRSGSVWTCVIVHFVNNLFTVVFEFTLPADIFVSWVACLCGGLVAVGTIVVCVLFVKPTKYAITPQEEPIPRDTFRLSAFLLTVCVFCILWVMTLLA